ncbi:MAG: aminotransferase class I/II-fold pyridoxal phosphate-dependent enzyme [Verrucomicrobiales bacterium]|nr:aminotransferase class I/II-fold pyridoxal phosphate-dependent enzyme [Verrucomicrobiales bacterium]
MSLSNKLSKQVKNIPRSGIRDFFELVLGRDDVISLGVGEPDFSTPWHIREAAIYSLEKGETSYTSNLGLEKLRVSISDYVSQCFGVDYDSGSEVLVTVGVSEALDLACRALLNPGDEVLYHEPCYVSYDPSIRLAYGVPVPVSATVEDEFSVKAEEIENLVTPNTRILILNFPTNPTGAVMEKEELQKIADICIANDLIVITDEIYSELVYEEEYKHVSIASLSGMKERTILLHGFSKAFAMTGFRLGYSCAPPEITEAMMKIHQYSMLCAPITSQVAAIEALKNGAKAVEKMRQDYKKRRDLIVGEFNDMGLPCNVPGGAFYAFPDIRGTGLTSKEFASALLESQNVAAVPGDAFGSSGEGFLRCCYATDVKLIRSALDGFRKFLVDIKR